MRYNVGASPRSQTLTCGQRLPTPIPEGSGHKVGAWPLPCPSVEDLQLPTKVQVRLTDQVGMTYIENMNADDAITEGRRLTALELALNHLYEGDLLTTAKAFESYLKGEGTDNTPTTPNTGKPSL